MAEIIKNRTIRPLSRSETSKNYRVDVSNVTKSDRLIVNITHDSLPFKRSFTFDGKEFQNRKSIHFNVTETDGRIQIAWSKVTPGKVVDSIGHSSVDKLHKNLKSEVNEKESRLFRLTYNTNGWTIPSGHPWKISLQGNSGVPFENQFGFGGEEWLFNPNFQSEGVQYGYIRGAEELSVVKLLKKAYLFTYERNSRERYLVGAISNLEIIKTHSPQRNVADSLLNEYFEEMKADLIKVGADVKGFTKSNFRCNVSFKLEDMDIYSMPLLITSLKGQKYNRFKPYIVNKGLKEILDGVLPSDEFIFRPGIAKNSKTFDRTIDIGTTTVNRTHSEITENLAKYLQVKYSITKDRVSVEKTYFGANIADVVMKEIDDEYSIFEVKTSNNARKNIRESLGQLLDYAFWYKKIRVQSLIIVSPSELTKNERLMFQRLQFAMNLNIKYWQYLRIDGGKANFKEIL
ncbi:hypothetical protein OQY15_04670 [Pedobacter sp. MC2016-15]|uniref:hypothetical protein n=1 Tax=Pedobacter sp. MC2016-15 TaxID=2994473 RepID=UPI00224827F6|nr:hypothetical protein [Pedobacter sp. MC2016-15]MCX2478371.1 hypothetical protein [Pedobacter sp. MC2016-15]